MNFDWVAHDKWVAVSARPSTATLHSDLKMEKSVKKFLKTNQNIDLKNVDFRLFNQAEDSKDSNFLLLF